MNGFWVKIPLKFVLTCPINNIPAMVEIMAWCRSDNKPLSEPMVVSLLTHICVTRPWSLQWRYNGHDGVSNHQPHHCLLNRLFRLRSMKTPKLRVTRPFVRGIHQWPVNTPHKGPVTRKMFPFDDVILDDFTSSVVCGLLYLLRVIQMVHVLLQKTSVNFCKRGKLYIYIYEQGQTGWGGGGRRLHISS